jgi:glycosyltransferase involved in cell wall biosynthesis
MRDAPRDDAKPNLLVLTTTFPRWVGDAEPPFVYELSRRLAAQFSVMVLAPRAPGAAVSERMGGIGVVRYPYFFRSLERLAYQGGILANIRARPWRLLLVPFLVLGLWCALRKLLQGERIHVVHAHWLIPQASIAAFVLRGRAALAATAHGGDLYGLRGPVWDALRRLVLRRAATVTVVNEAMAAELQRKVGAQGANIHVIPMGVDLTSTFTPASIPREPEQLLFVGRLVGKKGCDVLIRALAILAARGRRLRLVVAGDGPERGRLEGLVRTLGVASQVTFLGAVANAQLPALYRKATALVAPFVESDDGDRDSFGLVLVEAMGCGCPVVTSQLALANPAVQPGSTAWIAEPGNADALADAITALIDDPEEARRRSVVAREEVVASFDWLAISTRYAALLLPLVVR